MFQVHALNMILLLLYLSNIIYPFMIQKLRDFYGHVSTSKGIGHLDWLNGQYIYTNFILYRG